MQLSNYPYFMTTTILSSKGQVVLPRLVRSQLHLAPGTKFFCEIQGDSVILRPAHARNFVREYVTDPQTGLRVTKADKKLELVTSDMVKTVLRRFLWDH